MPDVMDAVQQRVQDDLDKALKAQAVKSSVIGRDDCLECGEYIAPVRKSLGAQLCLECQKRIEEHAAKINRRGAY